MLAQIAHRKIAYKVFTSTWIVIVYAEIPNTAFTHTIHTRKHGRMRNRKKRRVSWKWLIEMKKKK